MIRTKEIGARAPAEANKRSEIINKMDRLYTFRTLNDLKWREKEHSKSPTTGREAVADILPSVVSISRGCGDDESLWGQAVVFGPVHNTTIR